MNFKHLVVPESKMPETTPPNNDGSMSSGNRKQLKELSGG